MKRMEDRGISDDTLENKEILDKMYSDDIITNVTHVTIL